MPLCHFAFGSLHRAGKPDEQTESILSNILLPKKLRSFCCPEFMPILNNLNGLIADPNSARVVGAGVTFDRWIPAPPVSLIPIEVWMICFVDIPFKKLRNWTPAEHYGKHGVVFTDKFRARAAVRRVVYYDRFVNLARDPMVLKLEKASQIQEQQEITRLRREVLENRKPARLWPELNSLFASLNLTMGVDGQAMIQKLTYSRYSEGYDFTIEKEARIVTSKEDRDVHFTESEVLAVITPDQKTQSLIRERLKRAWSVTPQVLVFPS